MKSAKDTSDSGSNKLIDELEKKRLAQEERMKKMDEILGNNRDSDNDSDGDSLDDNLDDDFDGEELMAMVYDHKSELDTKHGGFLALGQKDGLYTGIDNARNVPLLIN